MGRLITLSANGPALGPELPDGAFLATATRPPLPDLTVVNAGQGDSRERIKPNIAQAQQSTITAWEHGVLPSLATWASDPGPAVVLMPQDSVFALAPHLKHMRLIALEFPRFADGRGFSQARLLRERLHWTGDVRAVGDVLIDQLYYMKRCGFSSFALRGDQDEYRALSAFATFPSAYQTATDGAAPLYLREGDQQ